MITYERTWTATTKEWRWRQRMTVQETTRQMTIIPGRESEGMKTIGYQKQDEQKEGNEGHDDGRWEETGRGGEEGHKKYLPSSHHWWCSWIALHDSSCCTPSCWPWSMNSSRILFAIQDMNLDMSRVWVWGINGWSMNLTRIVPWIRGV